MVLSTLFSFVGLFFFLLGIVSLIFLPLVPAVTGVAHQLAAAHLWLGMWLKSRTAWVVDEHGGMTNKVMTYADPGVEEITVGGETKIFEDPAAALSHWMGFPMALADEVHGVLFDPRHAAVGARKRQAEEDDELLAIATEQEFESYDALMWYRGVLEFPRGVYELVNLSDVRQLICGSERADYPERVKEFYKKSREPYHSGASMLRLSMPVLGPIMVFGALWLMASYGPSPTGGGGSNTTISYGLLALALSLGSLISGLPSRARVKEIVETTLLYASVVVLLVGPWVLLYLVAGLATTIGALIAFFLGMVFLALVVLLSSVSAALAGPLAGIFLRLGFLAYYRPVFVWSPEGYRLVEYKHLEDVAPEPDWYYVFGRQFGFTFEPSPGSFSEVVPNVELEAKQELRPTTGPQRTGPASSLLGMGGTEARADGGTAFATNIPRGYTRYPDMARAADDNSRMCYRGFVPEDIDDEKYYLNSALALSRLRDAALGEKSHKKLLEAKDEYGGDSFGMNESTLLWATVATSTLAFVTGVFVFFI